MRQSKYRCYVQAGWVTLLSALMLSLVVTPVSATSSRAVHAAQRLDNATSVGASTYITTGTLVPLFQNRIDQHVPGAFNNAINNLVSTLPRQDQGWALQMATTLIQPSATLTGLTTQPGGLVTSLRISLYPGDPQPINSSMLVSFSVLIRQRYRSAQSRSMVVLRWSMGHWQPSRFPSVSLIVSIQRLHVAMLPWR